MAVEFGRGRSAPVGSVSREGMHMAREFNRGHILAALDRGVPEVQIMEVLGVGLSLIHI